jgi:hypothetical protein
MVKSILVPLSCVIAFAVTFALVEAAVVVYLRALYYPEGFQFPLSVMNWHHVTVEIAREGATMLMLTSVALLAGGSRWERVGYFLIAFAVWDIFYYVWLKIFLDWPQSILDWDVLFLIPLPWIGPVIAPVLISVALILAGCIMIAHEKRSAGFRIRWAEALTALVSTGVLLYSFMIDTKATLYGANPEPYNYLLFALGMTGYGLILWRFWGRLPRNISSNASLTRGPKT